MRLPSVLLITCATLWLGACGPPAQLVAIDSYLRPGLTPHYFSAPDDPRFDPQAVSLLQQARDAEQQDDAQAASLYLQAARAVYQTAREDPELRTAELRELYNRAVAGFVRTRGHTTDLVRFEPHPFALDPASFDELIPAGDRRVLGFRHHHVRTGVGAPLIGVHHTDSDIPAEAHYPPEGLYQPVTAFIRFANNSEADASEADKPVFFLLDVRRAQQVDVLGEPASLAADFTAPYAMLIANNEIQRLGRRGLMNPAVLDDRLGVYMMEPYDPDKTPVLMVHGLMATPIIWSEMTNDLMGDPQLLDRIQVWHYFYPTGPCPVYTAYLLRDQLEQMRAIYDPEQDDRAFKDLIVIGHSMGGILSRTLVTDSGSAVWDTMFTAQPDELAGDTTQRELTKNVLMFSPHPGVSRVVFIATPHRGSNLANSPVGWIGDAAVSLPEGCVEGVRDFAEANKTHLTPSVGRRTLAGPYSSIDSLEPNAPVISALSELPIAEHVHAHSIIGTRTTYGTQNPQGTTDGVVAYWSSHLEGVISEALVPSNHMAQQHEESIDEVRRILREHFGLPEPEDETSPEVDVDDEALF